MRAKIRHFRKEATYKLFAIGGLVCTAIVFCVMALGGLVLSILAGIGYRLSA